MECSRLLTHVNDAITIRTIKYIAHQGFCAMYFNCRSLPPKIDELSALCAAKSPDVVCLVETWLSPDILASEVAISNYSLVRLDRHRHGGGVAILHPYNGC